MIAKELGPAFMQKGVIIEGNRFHEFVLQNSADLRAACRAIHVNKEKTDVDGLLQRNWENMDILLTVAAEQKL